MPRHGAEPAGLERNHRTFEHLDVTYEADGATDEIVEHVISCLAEDTGALRCRHGDRLIVLYGRGVATVEVVPRGAVL